MAPLRMTAPTSRISASTTPPPPPHQPCRPRKLPPSLRRRQEQVESLFGEVQSLVRRMDEIGRAEVSSFRELVVPPTQPAHPTSSPPDPATASYDSAAAAEFFRDLPADPPAAPADPAAEPGRNGEEGA